MPYAMKFSFHNAGFRVTLKMMYKNVEINDNNYEVQHLRNSAIQVLRIFQEEYFFAKFAPATKKLECNHFITSLLRYNN